MGKAQKCVLLHFALLGRKVAKQTKKRNAAGRFEGRAEGSTPGGGVKRVMRTKVKAAWPDIADKMVAAAKEGDFRATKWLWDECGLGKESPRKRRGTKSGFAQTLIDEFKSQQAARQQTGGAESSEPIQ